MFYWCIWACMYGAVGYMSEEIKPWNWYDCLLLLALFFELICIHICIYLMNALEKRLSYITILLNMQIIWSFLSSWSYFGEEIYLINILGAVIVVICGSIIVIDKDKKIGVRS